MLFLKYFLKFILRNRWCSRHNCAQLKRWPRQHGYDTLHTLTRLGLPTKFIEIRFS